MACNDAKIFIFFSDKALFVVFINPEKITWLHASLNFLLKQGCGWAALLKF